MRYRPFGETGLYVSELSLGGMTFGKGAGLWQVLGTVGAEEAEGIIARAFDAGVNLIDTADSYSQGQSEEIIGTALAKLGRARDSVLLATKVRTRTGPGPNDIGLSRGHILSSIDASLRRLRVDHVDLLQIHGVDPETPIEDTMRALDDVVTAGKARYLGFCNMPAWHAMKAMGWADARDRARFASAQMYYSLVGRDIEREVVPLVEDQRLAFLAWGPLAGGLLSGKFDAEERGPQGARRSSLAIPLVDRPRLGRVLAALRAVSQATGVAMAPIAIAWLLARRAVSSVILGATTREQLEENLAAGDITLAPEHAAQLDEASALPSEYPQWMVEWQNRDRRPPTA